MDLDSFSLVLQEHFALKARVITGFAGTGYSFEQWFNWELFSAFSSWGVNCDPKPAYRQTFASECPGQLGDLLIEGRDGGKWIVEVALVRGFTQDKWRAKLINDRLKLADADQGVVRKLL